MSLVAYAASSDEESHSDDEQETIHATRPPLASNSTTNGHISDEDEDYAPVAVGLQELRKQSTFTLTLPKPKHSIGVITTASDELEADLTPTFAKLPMPKSAADSSMTIEEVDDEFLHKKAIPLHAETKEKPPPRGPVKIVIPSLAEFRDVDAELFLKSKSKPLASSSVKKSGLLSMLPQAKSEQNFAKPPTSIPFSEDVGSSGVVKKAIAFVPDTVKNRRPARNTEGVDISAAPKKPPKTATKPKLSLVACSDSEDSEEDTPSASDFFSLNTDEQLPDVSVNEINAMVAKRAAKMAVATNQYLSKAEAEKQAEEHEMEQETEMGSSLKRHQPELDQQAITALVGSSAKRRRKEQEIQVVDISSEQVLPSRDEWLRTALASSTAYQPTGVLVDEEPAAGTRRKHQITYLAHKAKANEAELQAMWAANRQNRRATQSKYGF